jgi:hypothetical protein
LLNSKHDVLGANSPELLNNLFENTAQNQTVASVLKEIVKTDMFAEHDARNLSAYLRKRNISL